MTFSPRYEAKEAESRLQAYWHEKQTYAFKNDGARPVFSIDTPPPTVSGRLHIGHVFSYTQTDVIARYRRMTGFDVFYPMGFDDNGLPTEMLTEKENGVRASQMSREDFVKLCLKTSSEFRGIYQNLWESLGFSVDWKQSYSTISDECRRISQKSFLDLLKKGKLYRKKMPTLWCPKSQSTIAQAELESVPKAGWYNFFNFECEGEKLPIASTRPELLPACVAVFIHPKNEKYARFIGKKAKTPLFDLEVPILADEKADPEKGTGIVMCCTFGDATDVEWFRQHNLDLRIVLNRDGTLNELAGELAGLSCEDAREAIVKIMQEKALLFDRKEIPAEQHMVNVNPRYNSVVEYLDTEQWFIDILGHKTELLEMGDKINWHPEYMKVRYRNWVENLGWDWAISRQRYFGVPIPVWYTKSGKVIVPDEADLPINPLVDLPKGLSEAELSEIVPDPDVLDTWATSSVTPQICARWGEQSENPRLRPMSMRPQAHDIIRTWAFYTIVKSLYHFNDVPWKDAVISGHVVKKDVETEVQTQSLAGSKVQRKSKISKSKDGEKFAPQRLIESFSADSIRYWTCGCKLGIDVYFDEKEIEENQRLLTKLWNASRFVAEMLGDFDPAKIKLNPENLSVVDRGLLSRLSGTIARYRQSMDSFEFSPARLEVERFFWSDFCDNYIEYVKDRLYKVEKRGQQSKEAAQATLYYALFTQLQLFAPFMPHITEELYLGLFAPYMDTHSIHLSQIPEASYFPRDNEAEEKVALLSEIITYARGYKSSRGYSLKQPIDTLYLRGATAEEKLAGLEADILAISISAHLCCKSEQKELSFEKLGETEFEIAIELDAHALAINEWANRVRSVVAEAKKEKGLKAKDCAGALTLYFSGCQDFAKDAESFANALKLNSVSFASDSAGLSTGEDGIYFRIEI